MFTDDDLLADGAPVPAAAGSAQAAAAAEAGSSRQVAGSGRRARILPYLLIAPSIAAFALLLGYPLYLNVKISLQKLDLAELVQRLTVFRGLANYRAIFSDPFFWSVTLRTVLFTVACAGLTMVLGTLVALLLDRLGKTMRLLLSISLVLAWAMPALTATVVWQWLFDTQFGVVNWLLTRLGADFANHSWFATGLSTFAIIVVIVVWQAIPFVAFTLYAGLTAIPRELYDAIRVDGAGAWRTFRSLIAPILRPLFLITAFLSIIWDFKLFTQIWLVRQGGPNRQTITLGIYAYQEGIASGHFGKAAAISMVMVLMLLSVLVYHIRTMLRTQEDL
ncbi:MAG TPA: sugar ABC transporter permease [Actinomycetes bacterium]|nr:sugar ABC transporter permease [Actinomycetes bacterium]